MSKNHVSGERITSLTKIVAITNYLSMLGRHKNEAIN